MTALTFLGASGGCGATTMAAITAHVMVGSGMGEPALVARDHESLARRVGSLGPATAAAPVEVIDAGRFTPDLAAQSLDRGILVLVGAHAPRGLEALDAAVATLDAHWGRSVFDRVMIVRCATFGAVATPQDPQSLFVPFDRALAAGGSVSDALEYLGTPARAMVWQTWLGVVRGVVPPR